MRQTFTPQHWDPVLIVENWEFVRFDARLRQIILSEEQRITIAGSVVPFATGQPDGAVCGI